MLRKTNTLFGVLFLLLVVGGFAPKAQAAAQPEGDWCDYNYVIYPGADDNALGSNPCNTAFGPTNDYVGNNFTNALFSHLSFEISKPVDKKGQVDSGSQTAAYVPHQYFIISKTPNVSVQIRGGAFHPSGPKVDSSCNYQGQSPKEPGDRTVPGSDGDYALPFYNRLTPQGGGTVRIDSYTSCVADPFVYELYSLKDVHPGAGAGAATPYTPSSMGGGIDTSGGRQGGCAGGNCWSTMSKAGQERFKDAKYPQFNGYYVFLLKVASAIPGYDEGGGFQSGGDLNHGYVSGVHDFNPYGCPNVNGGGDELVCPWFAYRSVQQYQASFQCTGEVRSCIDITVLPPNLPTGPYVTNGYFLRAPKGTMISTAPSNIATSIQWSDAATNLVRGQQTRYDQEHGQMNESLRATAAGTYCRNGTTGAYTDQDFSVSNADWDASSAGYNSDLNAYVEFPNRATRHQVYTDRDLSDNWRANLWYIRMNDGYDFGKHQAAQPTLAIQNWQAQNLLFFGDALFTWGTMPFCGTDNMKNLEGPGIKNGKPSANTKFKFQYDAHAGAKPTFWRLMVDNVTKASGNTTSFNNPQVISKTVNLSGFSTGQHTWKVCATTDPASAFADTDTIAAKGRYGGSSNPGGTIWDCGPPKTFGQAVPCTYFATVTNGTATTSTTTPYPLVSANGAFCGFFYNGQDGIRSSNIALRTAHEETSKRFMKTAVSIDGNLLDAKPFAYEAVPQKTSTPKTIIKTHTVDPANYPGLNGVPGSHKFGACTTGYNYKQTPVPLYFANGMYTLNPGGSQAGYAFRDPYSDQFGQRTIQIHSYGRSYYAYGGSTRYTVASPDYFSTTNGSGPANYKTRAYYAQYPNGTRFYFDADWWRSNQSAPPAKYRWGQNGANGTKIYWDKKDAQYDQTDYGIINVFPKAGPYKDRSGMYVYGGPPNPPAYAINMNNPPPADNSLTGWACTESPFQMNQEAAVAPAPDSLPNGAHINYQCAITPPLAVTVNDVDATTFPGFVQQSVVRFNVAWAGGTKRIQTSWSRIVQSGSEVTSNDVRVDNQSLTDWMKTNIPAGSDVGWTAESADLTGSSDLNPSDYFGAQFIGSPAFNRDYGGDPIFNQPLPGATFKRSKPSALQTFHKNTKPNLEATSTKRILVDNVPVTTIPDGQTVTVEVKIANSGETPTANYNPVDYMGSSSDFEQPSNFRVSYNGGTETQVGITPNRVSGVWKSDFGPNPGNGGEISPGGYLTLRYNIRANRNQGITPTAGSDTGGNFAHTVAPTDEHTDIAYQEDYCGGTLTPHKFNAGTGAKVAAPYVKAKRGSVHSNGSITGYDAASGDQNATFTVTATGDLVHFTSALGALGAISKYNTNVSDVCNAVPTGGIDWRKKMIDNINRLKRGAKVTKPGGANLAASDLDFTSAEYPPNGKVREVNGDVTIPAGLTIQGVGTLIVNGKLTIAGNMKYAADRTANSLGVIVLGDVVVDKSVTQMVGSYYVSDVDFTGSGPLRPGPNGATCPALNTETVPGKDPATEKPVTLAKQGLMQTGLSGSPLNLDGVVVAREFDFQRYLQTAGNSTADATENFYYDGRVVANPPPGFGTFKESTWFEIAP